MFLLQIVMLEAAVFQKVLFLHSQTAKDVTLTIYYADVANAVLDGIQNRNFDLTIEGEAKGTVFFDLFTVSSRFVSTYSYP